MICFKPRRPLVVSLLSTLGMMGSSGVLAQAASPNKPPAELEAVVVSSTDAQAERRTSTASKIVVG